MNEIRICFIGESFVNGTGDSSHLGWTGRLCKALSQQAYQVTYYNLGIRGETSAELILRWQSEVERRLRVGHNNRIVFSFGTNDTTMESNKLRVEYADSLKNNTRSLTRAFQGFCCDMSGVGNSLSRCIYSLAILSDLDD
jgi:lysophospholipase L1-like esterase